MTYRSHHPETERCLVYRPLLFFDNLIAKMKKDLNLQYFLWEYQKLS